jgi:hypothetical protein
MLLDFGTLLGQIVERALPPEDEPPPKLSITLVSRPTSHLDFDVVPPPAREGLMVIDLRTTRTPVPMPQDTQEATWAPPEPPAIPESPPKAEDVPEPPPAVSEDALWSKVRLRP